MTTRIEPEVEQKIIERLENDEDKDNIILDVAERQGMDWKEAEALVNSIQAEHANDITLAQSPLLVLIALAFFIGGLVMVSICFYDIVSVYIEYATAKSLAGTGFVLYLFAYGGFFWEFGLLGLAMMIGSLRGMTDVWTAIFEKLGIFQ